MTFEERKKELSEKIMQLMQDYEIDLVAVNAVTKDGEVHPCVKMYDVEQKLLTNEKVNDNKTEEVTSSNKEEQK